MTDRGAVSAVDYSIVIPVYYNEGLLTDTMASLQRDVIDCNPGLSCEVIFVDDGSGDGSLAELIQIYEHNPDLVRILQLSRNFGQVSALLAGFARARGRCVVAMSADGQDPAALVNDMLHAHRQEGYEVVICTREGRDESLYRVLTSKLFYSLIRRLSFPQMPAEGFDFVLLGRRALTVLLRNQEVHPFFQGQILWLGFKARFIQYRRQARKIGTSRWTFGKKFTYLIDGVMSYSYFPLRLMSGTGIAVALLGFVYALVVLLFKIIWGNPVQGWTPLMIVVLIMGGVQMLMLGVIGEYLWRTLDQVRNRDPYIVDKVWGKVDPCEADGNTAEQGA
ncbi:MAG: glycosyltransferase [Chloroflexi bacterium]|nr:MAG: glycosyltransferase [Chloroflexota bacterium]